MPILGKETAPQFLAGQLLVAMPQLSDGPFNRSVVYLCAHDERGATGLIINKLVEGLTVAELMDQLGIEGPPQTRKTRVHFGGPVECGRGFVLHSTDYVEDTTIVVEDGLALTATVEILRKISTGNGPAKRILTLGYAGWGPGQLDNEIQENGWLVVPPDDSLVFDGQLESKWRRAYAKLGVELGLFSSEAGHA